MPLTLHPLARTTPRIRAELRAEPSQVSDAELGRRYGIAPQTARKWRRRKSVADRSHRPRHLHCTMTPAQEV
ncbi:MAG TPA: IS481 family transposase, partial [Nevskiaceae bacterium]|nr:IS481 family transposase [Nevskiaceae bacterium]